MSKVLGDMFRTAGEQLATLGTFLKGSHAHKEQLNRHRRVMGFLKSRPAVGSNVFIAPNATVIGKVNVGNGSSIYYNSVVRGDTDAITIGSNTNIQDRVVIQVNSVSGTDSNSTTIGDNVTIEPGCVLRGCVIENEVFVAAGSTILHGAVVGSRSMIEQGSTVTAGTVVPSGEKWGGTPAKHIRKLTEEEQNSIKFSSERQKELAAEHIKENDKEFYQLQAEIDHVEYREDKLAFYNYNPVRKEL
ncbi:gamma carbonic anhydrase GAMMACA2, mitochondrial [Acrasis kona]|uniref:Gamma carbonic anhydrase GAMMACA2, mitochondrial n=1 Tax=Acrasis kona TaxID=1008807 RepID=A0AAW2YLT1_9EUKA